MLDVFFKKKVIATFSFVTHLPGFLRTQKARTEALGKVSGLVLLYIYETRKKTSFFSKPALNPVKRKVGEGGKEDQTLQLRSQKRSVMS